MTSKLCTRCHAPWLLMGNVWFCRYCENVEVNSMNLQEMADIVREINVTNGWYDNDRSFGDDIALLHSEVSEAFEGYRNHDPANVAEELADVLIRLLDTSDRYGVDLEAQFVKKCAKNRERGHRHGGKAV